MQPSLGKAMTGVADVDNGFTASASAVGYQSQAVRRVSKYRRWKNLLDRVLAFCALVVLSPFMALLVVLIKLDSPGSAIHRREQIGENGRGFIAYKFRTMREGNDDREYKQYLVKYIRENAPYAVDDKGQGVYKVINDPRVTRFGSFLRRTNLDELPQPVNMLKGEMSLVGPRPDIPFAVTMYQDWHRERLNARPGITGLWQVRRRKSLSFEDMVQLDIEYINKQSLLLDIKIAILTVRTVLSRDGS